MPYLHLDLPLAVDGERRKRITTRLARVYADGLSRDWTPGAEI
jgi:hypothetical protein